MLRQLRYILHENHYLITDCKRRLIDIYGHSKGYEYERLGKEVLERKCDYCDHLLSLQAVLSPGKSEFRGYVCSQIIRCFSSREICDKVFVVGETWRHAEISAMGLAQNEGNTI